MPDTAAEHRGTVGAALANVQRLLAARPQLAHEQALEILRAEPDHPAGLFALGLTLARFGRHHEAIEALRQSVARDPSSAPAWRALGDQLTLIDDNAGADDAYAQSIRASINDPRLMDAARALCEGKLAIAEHLLRPHLHDHPTDVAAMRLLAETGARLGRYDAAEKLLARCLELAPSFIAARHNYALVLHRQSKAKEALTQIDLLLTADAANPSYRFLRASALTRIGEYDAAITAYEEILAEYPQNARGWLSLGHARKTAGQAGACVSAYARSIEIAPHFGEAYWSLANMKTHRFSDDDIEAMLKQCARSDLTAEDHFHLHYALGKAFEDRGAYERSFKHYEQGAKSRRAALFYSADETTAFTREHIALFTQAFLAQRRDYGANAPDPIFVVGLPRSGSTLIEQILASHSLVEGTMELPDVGMIAKRMGKGKTRGSCYPSAVADMSAGELKALGDDYIGRTRVQRKTVRPFFIDKMPNNFQHLGLIMLMLPNAKIIDVRRHPMAACFSAYKQHFARGQSFSYDLADLARYYHDYVALMAHFDSAAPGRIHRVHYEQVVAEPEAEIRRLLAYCGLQFEASCLSFHTNTRAVRTASSEQVRQPLYAEAVDHWRNYGPWLEPLKAALGELTQTYPHI